MAPVGRAPRRVGHRQDRASIVGRTDCRPRRLPAVSIVGSAEARQRSGTPAAFDHPLPASRLAEGAGGTPPPPGCERALVILHTPRDTGGHPPRAPLAAPPENPANPLLGPSDQSFISISDDP